MKTIDISPEQLDALAVAILSAIERGVNGVQTGENLVSLRSHLLYALGLPASESLADSETITRLNLIESLKTRPLRWIRRFAGDFRPEVTALWGGYEGVQTHEFSFIPDDAFVTVLLQPNAPIEDVCIYLHRLADYLAGGRLVSLVGMPDSESLSTSSTPSSSSTSSSPNIDDSSADNAPSAHDKAGFVGDGDTANRGEWEGDVPSSGE